MRPSGTTHSAHRSAAQRLLFGTIGMLSLGLGIIGIVVPGLPTTPFVLLAAACFAKASPKLHGWLLQHRLLGPFIRNWEEHRSLTKRTKFVAITTMLVTIGFSAWSFSGRPLAQVCLLGLGAIGAVCVLRIPTRALHAKATVKSTANPVD